MKHVLSLVLSRSSSTVFLRSSHAEAILEHPSCYILKVLTYLSLVHLSVFGVRLTMTATA
jgi:hypothetical protein